MIHPTAPTAMPRLAVDPAPVSSPLSAPLHARDTSPDLARVQVLAYFPDDQTRAYQLLQWLPVLDVLDTTRPVAIVLRDPATADVVRAHTALPIALVPEFGELTVLYASTDAAVVLYCNNSMLNFQSLLDPSKLHVHVNHGESDKQSMASNNAKAYDRVFVAGEAAVQRYLGELMEFDEARLVRVGRPQLDLRPAPLLAPTDCATVLYAPTWEGDADYNNFSSVDTIGVAIMRAVLAMPGVRAVYKPHPKVVTSPDPAIREAHREIVRMVARAAALEPGVGHTSVEIGDILAVIPDCDAMISDVSSVGLDWLYLRTDAPILITDRHGDAERLRREVPVSRCADVVDGEMLDRLGAVLAARLDPAGDELHLARQAMRRHYFDDLQVGDSTARFVEQVGALVALRHRLRGVDESAATA
ncbi:CDP-glycerol glycerophosphotransferase family protein [Nocardioides sp. R-C-SC26]|uniref:CDP-glycerol glycerophosphotransferase family protein n=1 Tax=Nocardioides sp. R-C-SC26 TaxID=2870414 RepID=UPI001E4836FB|nr:CDP-glycerol glycerophosphotransferase family protein [Nocardioides sp. R-C-SC26]